MKYMLWYMGEDKEKWQGKLKEALTYYKKKYGEPLSILTSIHLSDELLTEQSLIERETIPDYHIGITSEPIQSEG